MPLYKTEGIILRKQEYGETDEIISLLSPDLGKKKILVKGVRKIKGSMVGKFELFCTIRALFARGRTFDVCTQVEVLSSRPLLRNDLTKVAYGLYYLELFDALLLFSEPNRGFYDLLGESLDHLVRSLRPELLSLRLMYNFLSTLGYQPSVEQCAVCRKKVEDGYFSMMRGGTICDDCFPADRSAAKIGRRAISVLERLPAFSCAAVEGSDVADEEAARAVRNILERYIAYHFSKNLQGGHLIGKVSSLERISAAG